jgi:hypothetical protein
MRHDGLTVFTRRNWGSKEAAVYAWRRAHKPHFLLPRQPVDTVWQHITVTHPSTKFSTAVENFFEDCRTIESIGKTRFGTGVSYNLLVDMTYGFVGVGQPFDAKGSHTLNYKGIPEYTYDQNGVALAIAVIGMPDTRLSSRSETVIARILHRLVKENFVTPGFDYVPHSLVAAKDCPCDETRNKMSRIRMTAVAGLQ